MAREPIYEKSVEVKQIGYTLSVRARPSTIRRTVLRLLPWAVYAALPQGRAARLALLVARRFSPMWTRRMH